MRRFIPYVSAGGTSVQRSSSRGDWRVELSNFLQRYSAPVLMFLYPTRAELKDPALRKGRLDIHGDEATALFNKRIMVVSIADDLRWTSDLYRDPIHPTAAGNETLAQIIASSIKVDDSLSRREGRRGHYRELLRMCLN